MTIRLSNNAFIRHAADESVVWCPCSGGCTVMRNAKPILEEVPREWRSVDDIVRVVAAKFECGVEEIKEGVEEVVEELRSQHFVEVRSMEDISTVSVVDVALSNDTFASLMNGQEIREDNDQIDEFFARHGIVSEFHIDLTDACTERCVHCYVPKGQKDFLPIEFVEKALVEFREMNGLTVHLTGGEAMMHSDFERICRKCVELNLNFIIFSNMTLCDEKRIAFLKEVQTQFINVSLYSMDSAAHDAITQVPGSWQRTYDAIVKCCEAGVACRIATPLLKENQDALPALRKFADEYRMHLVPSADIIAQADHGCGNLAHACSTEELRRVMTRDRDLFHKVYNAKMPACDA